MRGGLVEQPARNELQAIRRIDQATIQRWTGDFGNRARLRPSTASTQRIAACVHQRQTQEVGCTAPPPRANKSFEFACRLFNRHELADPSQSRGPGAKPQRIAHAWLNRSPMVTVMLTPMPPTPPHKGEGSAPSSRPRIGFELWKRSPSTAERKRGTHFIAPPAPPRGFPA